MNPSRAARAAVASGLVIVLCAVNALFAQGGDWSSRFKRSTIRSGSFVLVSPGSKNISFRKSPNPMAGLIFEDDCTIREVLADGTWILDREGIHMTEQPDPSSAEPGGAKHWVSRKISDGTTEVIAFVPTEPSAPAQAAPVPNATQGSAIEDAATWQTLKAVFGGRLNDNAIQLLAAARQEPIELRMARGLAGMFFGKASAVDLALIDASLSAERATLDAEVKVPAVLAARLDLRLLQLAQVGGAKGLAPIEGAQKPDAVWASDMVRIGCLIESRTSPELVAARSKAKELAASVLSSRAEYAALFDDVAQVVQKGGLSAERVRLYREAKNANGCK